jgi:UDP-N-acetylglucosamine 2-epimerase (non-hydrolysing)
VILFLGDSNTVLSAPFLKKEGLRIGHIEAGMRSYDMRMLEEVNRKVCDHVSDILFTYHQDYKEILLKEGIDKDIHVVGNTIVEPCSIYSKQFVEKPSFESHIVLDIHRPENFKSAIRLANIFDFARGCGSRYDLPVKMIDFKRALFYLDEFGIDTDGIEHLDVMSYTDYLEFQYNAYCIISDSGTAQEEPALLKVPVIVPRDYTERPQSMENNCSVLVNVNSRNDSWTEAFTWLDYIKYDKNKINSSWLGDGTASKQIVDTLKTWL